MTAPSADAKAEKGWLESLKLFDVASLGFQKAVKSLQKTEGSIAVDGAQIGASFNGPEDPLSHSTFVPVS